MTPPNYDLEDVPLDQSRDFRFHFILFVTISSKISPMIYRIMILSWLFFKKLQEQMSQIHFSKKWEIVQGSLCDTNPHRKPLKITTKLYQVWFTPKMGSQLWKQIEGSVLLKMLSCLAKCNTPTKKMENIGKHLKYYQKALNTYIYIFYFK